jgi:flagellar basal body-associated protein FliL
MAKNKKNLLVIALVVVVVLLVGFLGYLFLIRPALSGLVTQGYNQGYQTAVLTVAQQTAQCPTAGVPLTIGDQKITLFAAECYQQPAQQTQ